MLAAETRSKLYFFHLSTAWGLAQIREAQQKGLPVYAETCPQYLLLTRDKYKESGFKSARYVMSPPLRGIEDQSALWSGLADGSLQVVGSDHCPFRTDQKELGRGSFDRIPNGGPGVETLAAPFIVGRCWKRSPDNGTFSGDRFHGTCQALWTLPQEGGCHGRVGRRPGDY